MRYKILGIHQTGTPFVLLAGDAPESTAIHEAVHYAGVSSEPLTRVITRGLQLRASTSLGILRRDVRYDEAQVTQAETAAFLQSMRLSAVPGDARQVELIHLVYTP